MKKMRVGYVLPTLRKRAGWRTFTISLLSSLAADVDPLLFVANADAGEARELFPQSEIHPLPVTQAAWLSSPRGFVQLASCFMKILSSRPPHVDLIHSLEAYPSGLVGHWLARRTSNRCHILTCHGTYGILAHANRLDRLAYQAVLKSAAAVCTVSQGTVAQMRKYFGDALGETRVAPILNGNHAYQLVSRETALQRPAQAAPVLLSVGDIKPRKGQDASLAAFALVKQEFPDAQYWIVGDPHPTSTFYQQLQKTIQEKNIRDVKFLDLVSDAELERCYREATVFVLTPRQVGMNFEGFGLVYLEAGAYGLPVVATRSGGVPEAVKDQETGLLADEGDVTGIAQAICSILRNPGLARRLGEANRLWSETLTWERAAEQYLRVYRSALGQS